MLNHSDLDVMLHALQQSSRKLLEWQRSKCDNVDASSSSLKLAEELDIVVEEINIVSKKVIQQQEHLVLLNKKMVSQQINQQEQFDFAQLACVNTRPDGIMLQVNRAAAQLFNKSPDYLVGKPLSACLSFKSRRAYWQQLHQNQEQSTEQVLQLEPCGCEAMDAVFKATSFSDGNGGSLIQWTIQPLGAEQSVPGVAPESTKPAVTFAKGTVIPLTTSKLWVVQQGLVKLTVTCESGDEVLLGLVAPGRLIGGSYALLPTYCATVLSGQAQLVDFSADDPTYARLQPMLSNAVQQRLQQAEQLLWAMGHRRVEDRIYHFLQVLTQEFGEPVQEGSRITVRLTHQEIADACCTTRVTTTRVLNRLIRDGKLLLDDQRCLILLNGLL